MAQFFLKLYRYTAVDISHVSLFLGGFPHPLLTSLFSQGLLLFFSFSFTVWTYFYRARAQWCVTGGI